MITVGEVGSLFRGVAGAAVEGEDTLSSNGEDYDEDGDEDVGMRHGGDLL